VDEDALQMAVPFLIAKTVTGLAGLDEDEEGVEGDDDPVK
jgi:hypothetical protein